MGTGCGDTGYSWELRAAGLQVSFHCQNKSLVWQFEALGSSKVPHLESTPSSGLGVLWVRVKMQLAASKKQARRNSLKASSEGLSAHSLLFQNLVW